MKSESYRFYYSVGLRSIQPKSFHFDMRHRTINMIIGAHCME